MERELQSYGLDKYSMLKEKINKLSQTQSPLIDEIVVYRGYSIGVLVKSYLDYENLADIFPKLEEEQKIFIRNKVEELYKDLMEYDIYPTDIKMNNILVNINNLDVKIIDLDDYDTVVGNKCHSRENSLLSLGKMLTQLDDYLEHIRHK